MRSHLRRTAVAAAVLVAGATAVALFVATGAGALDRLGSAVPDPSDAVIALCCVLGCAVVMWLALAMLVSVLAEGVGVIGRFGRAAAGRIAPTAIRRFTAVATGAAVALAGVAPASAAESVAAVHPVAAMATAGASTTGGSGPTDPIGAAPATAPLAPDPGFRPTRPTNQVPTPTLGPITTPVRVTAAQAQDPEMVVVRRGDTLWDIAARDLSPDAGAAQIAAAWPRWYDANRQVIGDDPNLLHPGQQLVRPEARATGASTGAPTGAPTGAGAR